MEAEMMEAGSTTAAVHEAVADFGVRNGLDYSALGVLEKLSPNVARLVIPHHLVIITFSILLT
eukprot:gene18476-9883_t